ncbi:MAG TPA: RluA family pseudouridine synthase [Gammaproteobacteria bacterium]|nr:RluA family pseudouridine synthase [Gammaproteobacteria bacterium]
MEDSREGARKGVQLIDIKEDQVGQRLDNFLQRVLNGAPRSLIYRLIRKGQIRVNKGRIKPGHKLKAGDLVRIPPLRLEVDDGPKVLPRGLLEEIRQSILFENDHCVVVDKPSGLAVHGGSGLRFGLLDIVRAIRPEQDYLELVHRLDRETSGCLLLAKNRQTLTFLHKQLKAGQVTKKYLAGLAGVWKAGKKTVSLRLKKNVIQGGERMVEVHPEGKMAVTHFNPVQKFDDLSLMEVVLETGRTHQIRVHALSEGYPVAGDRKYGNPAYNQWIKSFGLNRLFLHAHWLEFQLPDVSERIQINSPLPSGLKTVLNNLESE